MDWEDHRWAFAERLITMTQNTIFARTPKWVLRDKSLSLNAKAVYGALMLRADNVTLECWPSRQTLADDLGTSDSTVKRSLKELEDCGAIVVFRRKRKGTKENDTNRYRMVFDPPQPEGGVTGDQPRVTGEPTGGVTGEPVTRPTQLNPETRPTPLHPQQVEAPLYPQQVEADDSDNSFNDDSKNTFANHQPEKNRHGLSEETYVAARHIIQSIGEAHRDFVDVEKVWALQDQLTEFVEQNMLDQDWGYELSGLMGNEVSFTAKLADPYEAGKKLNTLISTAKIPRTERFKEQWYSEPVRNSKPTMAEINSWGANRVPPSVEEYGSDYRPF